MHRAQEAQLIAASGYIETPSGDQNRRFWIIRTRWNTPFSVFQDIVQKLPADGTLLTPESIPWQTYSALLSDAEVEEMKNNPIVLNMKIDQGGQTIDLQQELEYGVKRELREILKAVAGADSSGISQQARKIISGYMEKGTGQFPWESISEIDLDMVHSEIAIKAGNEGYLNWLWKDNWYRTRNSRITYLLSGISTPEIP